MEIAGHDIGTDWTVVRKLCAVELQVVKVWLAFSVLVLLCKMTNISPSNLGPLQRMFYRILQSLTQ